MCNSLLALFFAMIFFTSAGNAEEKIFCAKHLTSKVRKAWSTNKNPECQDLHKKYEALHKEASKACLAAARVPITDIDEQQQLASENLGCPVAFSNAEVYEISHSMVDYSKKNMAVELTNILSGYNNILEAPFVDKNWKCFGSSEDSVTREDFLNEAETMRLEIFDQLQLLSKSQNEMTKNNSQEPEDNRTFWKRVNDFLDRNKEPPFANLHPALRILASTVIGGIGWRIRGGFLNVGSSNGARYLGVGLSYMGLGYLNGGLDGVIAGALMLPATHVGYADYMNIGRTGNPKSRDALGMTARGLIQTALPGSFLMARGYGPGMLFSGAGMGACYWGSWEYMPKRWENSGYIGNTYLLDGPTSLAETCSGAVFGAGMSGTLLYGK
jgi:hypothetical protein